MPNGIPRRLLTELLTRWQLTHEKLLVVEGPSDRRMISLIQDEGHFTDPFAGLGVVEADAIDISAETLQRYDQVGTGAKQRVVAFAREVERHAAADGFRGVVDRDFDLFLGLDHRSPALLYTDGATMMSYLWSPEVLRRLLILFSCESKFPSKQEIHSLFASIGVVATELAAVRLVGLRHPEWALHIHASTRALAIENFVLQIDILRYLGQCRLPRDYFDQAATAVSEARIELAEHEPNDVACDHDLLWLLAYTIREFSAASRRVVDESVVSGGILSAGIMNETLPSQPLFATLAQWAAA